MKFLRVIPLALSALLAGCFGGDISTVKNSKLQSWPAFTVGQLLDKREGCTKTKWEKFTDDRNRAIVQYTCESDAVRDVFSNKIARDIASNDSLKALLRENAAKELEHEERSLSSTETKLAEQTKLVTTLVSQEGGLKAQALRADLARLQQVTPTSCAQANPQQYVDETVQGLVKNMAGSCSSAARFLANCPESMKADRARYLICAQTFHTSASNSPSVIVREVTDEVQRRLESLEQASNRRLRDEQEYLKALEGDLPERREALELARAKATNAPNNPEFAKIDAQSEKLRQKLAKFQRAHEVSQWTVQAGQPVYLGSRIELVFPDRTLQEQIKPEYVFEHAAKNARIARDLHGFYLMQLSTLWDSY